MVFTGGIRPRQRDLEALREAGLFAYLMEDETYDVASQVHDLLVKTHPANRAKIEEIKRLVTDHFDVDGLWLDRARRPEHAWPRLAAATAADRSPLRRR